MIETRMFKKLLEMGREEYFLPMLYLRTEYDSKGKLCCDDEWICDVKSSNSYHYNVHVMGKNVLEALEMAMGETRRLLDKLAKRRK